MKSKAFVFSKVRKNIVILKITLALAVLGPMFVDNAQAQTQAQTRKPVSKHVKDKIKKNVYNGSTSFGARVANDSVEIVMDDGFIKVEYVYEYISFGKKSKYTRREIYTTDGKELYISGNINTAKYISRIRHFPKKMEPVFSDYIVLGLEKKKSEGGHTVYNAYTKDGNLVAFANSLKQLHTKISDTKASETKSEPVVKKKKKKHFRRAMPHAVSRYTR